MVVAASPVSPIAALTVRAVHAALHEKKTVEAVVKQTLRRGSREGSVSNAEQRAAVASAVFGTSLLRARLGKLLAAATIPADLIDPTEVGAEVGETKAAWRRLAASRALLALFLLHETPQRIEDPRIMQLVLPPGSLGLCPSTLDHYAHLDIRRDVNWPSSPAMRLALEHSLPVGLARMWLRCAEGDQAEAAALAAAFNTPGPVMLRANVALSSGGGTEGARERLIDALRTELPSAVQAGSLRCRRGTLSPWAVALEGSSRAAWGGSVWSLESWRRGMFEVQDEGSQCIALACEAQEGEHVLDLCAGNGGKSLALAALVGEEGGRLLAHDVVESRLAALRASVGRALLSPAVVHTVATEMADAVDAAEVASLELQRAADAIAPGGFDVVLVDAPCSSSGTLRRHPGLRWNGQWAGNHSAQGAYPTLQLKLLLQAASLTKKPGGRLVYATCSLDPRENDQVADAFERTMQLQAADARLEAWPFEEGVAGRHEASQSVSNRRTLWPHKHGTDGFFVCRWRFAAQ